MSHHYIFLTPLQQKPTSVAPAPSPPLQHSTNPFEQEDSLNPFELQTSVTTVAEEMKVGVAALMSLYW